MQYLARQLGRWPIALLCVVAFGAALLLPGLAMGLWEPHERQLADKLAPPPDIAAKQKAQQPPPPPPAPRKDKCERSAPKDPVARSLSSRAVVWGSEKIGYDDTGRRMPFALLGLLTLIAAAGIAMRTAGPRAGLLTALVLGSMPLLIFQSRQLLSEIGLPASSALTLYGLVALGTPHRTRWLALVDSVVAVLALTAGIALGFYAGGALLGLLVPIGAFAVAHGLGVSVLPHFARATVHGVLALAGKVQPKLRAGRELSRPRHVWAWIELSVGFALISFAVVLAMLLHGRGSDASSTFGALAAGVPLVIHGTYVLSREANEEYIDGVKALFAALVAAGLVAWLTYEMFSLVQPQPGLTPPQRALFGKAIVASGCWSPALGGLWRADDDLRYSLDSTFEQIAYGTFPWGILGPIAMCALLASPEHRRRSIGALTLAWAGGAWIAAEVFQRKVGTTLWAGFPALGIAIGVWLDGVFVARNRAPNDPARSALPPGIRLIGLFVAFAIVDLGKDLQSFPDRITSLLVGGDQIAYPKMSRLGFFPTKTWLIILGTYLAFAFALALIAWRDTPPPSRKNFKPVREAAWILGLVVLPIGAVVRYLVQAGTRPQKLRALSDGGILASLVGTIVFGCFLSYVWHPRLSQHLSSRSMFEMFMDLRKPADQLVIMGDLGNAPREYAAGVTPELVQTRDQVVAAIGRDNRVFAIAPNTELCQLHREIGGKPYFVLDDRNTRSILLSNRVDGGTDKNPLRTTILHEEPKQIPIKPKARIVFDNRIELLGWDIPKAVGRGDKLTVKMFYKVLQPVGGNWRVLFHFDGALRFNGDHEPIKGRCQTSTWQPGDYIIDTHTVTAGGGAFQPGNYEVWTGFFTGAAPNWKNMAVSEAPPDQRDTADRVRITTIRLQ